jgi:hypothetical protein
MRGFQNKGVAEDKYRRNDAGAGRYENGDSMAELTSPSYWDVWWTSAKSVVISASDREYGRNGWFLRFMDMHCDVRGRTVAEIGGAMSYRLLSLAKWRGVRAVAIDYSVVGLKKTAELFKENGAKVECIHANMRDLSAQFDLLTHWGVLEHQCYVLSFMQDCRRLSPSMIFSMPNMLAWGMAEWRRYSPENFRRHIFHSDETVIEACRTAGYTCKPAFYGAPFISITPVEVRTVLSRSLSACQTWACRLGNILPYEYGYKRISEHRVFVCNLD